MIGTKTPEVAAYWRDCRAAKGIATEDYHACSFSDPALSPNVDKIGNLARIGQKRATAHLDLDFEMNGVRRRKVGDYWVVLDGAGRPLCLVRVTRIEVKPFEAVGADFAATEGEGDLSLEYWATVHRRYFRKLCAAWGTDWREDLDVVCESFELVHSDATEGGPS